jgi:hypothetical protein
MCLVLRICSGFFVNAIAPLLSQKIRVVGIAEDDANEEDGSEDALEVDSENDSEDDSEDDSEVDSGWWASYDSSS